MPEAPAVGVDLDETLEGHPVDGLDAEVLAVEQQVEGLGPEAAAEDRGAAQDLARRRWERVDVGPDDRLQRVRQRCGAAGELHEAQDLLKEQRVAGRPGDDRRDVVGAEGSGFGGGVDELLGLPGLQRFEVDGRGRLRREASGDRPADHHEQPRVLGAAGLHDAIEQVGGGLVHPVRVLDDEHDRAGHLPGDELDDDVGQAVPAEPGLDGVDLGCRVDGDVGDLADERLHRHQRGIELGDPPGEERGHRGLIGAEGCRAAPGRHPAARGRGSSCRRARRGRSR